MLYNCIKRGTELIKYTIGGSYTSNKINLLTNDKTCPPKYRPISIVNDIITEQIFGSDYIPKFGGMFSCEINELSTSDNGPCPSGFSAYVMGVIENGCILHVCLQLKTQDIRNLPSVSLSTYFNLLEHINISAPIINDSNATDENDLSIPTLRMNQKIIYQDTNSASKTCISWSFSLLIIFILGSDV